MKTLDRCIAVSFALTLAAGCASAAGTAPSSARPSPKAVTKMVTDRDKGTTVTLHVGDRLKVALASTYWTINPAAKPGVLRSDGRPVTTPHLNGCVPGGGCGTETQTFTAAAKGATIVSASRTTCGEALRCTGGNGEFSVSVVVK
jgi:hypothetical protein